jgi:hypothetical protein
MDQPQLSAQQGPKSVLQRYLGADYLCSYFSGLEHLELQLRGNELRSVVSLLIIWLYFLNIQMVESNSAVTQIELVEDSIILNEEFKKNVAIPYFKDIYRDLVSQSDSKTKGINKITLITVCSPSHSL